MGSKKIWLVFVIFAMLAGLSLLGVSWNTSRAQGTVPPAPPPAPALPVNFPTEGCQGPNLASVGGACQLEGADPMEINAVAQQVPGLTQITPLTDVMSIFDKSSKGLQGIPLEQKVNIYFELSPEELAAFKKDGSIYILWYNPETEKWEKIPTTLVSGSNKLVAEISFTGLYVVGSIKE